ncbi:Serine/threonine-protein kinase pim-1 [Labeo rohita]|uniref:non-specific serine/threonine protein kinase n=1 Tax=Labeo rohita TaxID=84645 RepID=A0ABQ8LU27_LABRO|nr:Serine/threonine-protein kinase pim-1 [Labeo rohita]
MLNFRKGPPKPSTNTEEQHPHPHDETPVDAALRRHPKGSSNSVQGEVEQLQEQNQQEIEPVKSQNECKTRCNDDFTVNHNQLDDQLGEGGLGAETRSLEDDPEVSVKQHNKTNKDVEAIITLVEGEADLPKEQEKQEQQREKVKPHKERKARCSDPFIFSHYQLGVLLGKGGFGAMYEVRCLEDDLKVAVKYVDKTEKYNEGLYLPGCQKHLPMEIALTMLANKGPKVPEIIQMLDWKDYRDHYVMILECPSPCETVGDFVWRLGGSLSESLARKIMRQVTQAAYICCQREVFHRDIKMTNLLINYETLASN